MLKSRIFLVLFTLLAACPALTGQNESMYKAENLSEHRSFQKYFDHADGKIAYIDIGKGEPILLLHGVPTSSFMYRKVARILVAEGYRVIMPDMLGYGGSDKPEGYEIYSPARHAERLKGLMDHLGIKEWNHVLHDAGGLWTWELIGKHPKSIKRMTVLNTIGKGFEPPVNFKKDKAWGKFILSRYKTRFPGKMIMGNTLKKGSGKMKFSKEEKLAYWTPMREGGNKAIYAFFTDFDNTLKNLETYHSYMKASGIPVSLVWGEDDPFLPADKIMDNIAESFGVSAENKHIVPGTHHFIAEEKPEDVAKLISTFFN